MPEATWCDAPFLAALHVLQQTLARRRVGQRRRSPPVAAGASGELLDRRPYLPGDEPRRIDWPLFARFERLSVRLFAEPQPAHLHLLVDRSDSMQHPFPEKWRLVRQLTVAAALSALAGGHRVSLWAIDRHCQRLLPPVQGRRRLGQIIACLDGLTTSAGGDPALACESFRLPEEARSAACLLSDCFGSEPERLATSLRRLGGRRCQLAVWQVLQQQELSPEFRGRYRLEDADAGASSTLRVDEAMLTEYRRRLDRWWTEVQSAAHARGCQLSRWYADREPLPQLIRHGQQYGPLLEAL